MIKVCELYYFIKEKIEMSIFIFYGTNKGGQYGTYDSVFYWESNRNKKNCFTVKTGYHIHLRFSPRIAVLVFVR